MSAARVPSETRILPLILEMRDPTRNEHQVDGPFTNDLIRNVNVAAFGVVGCGDQ